ncbi:MAG: M23 family metallopeptidase [Mariniphaga sp.]
MHKLLIFFAATVLVLKATGQDFNSAGFRWGNGFYYNMDAGERVTFNQVEVTLLKVHNHYNLLKVGEDTLWLKVARRKVPEVINGIRIFVADNKTVKALNPGSIAHGLLTGDALVCLSDSRLPLLDPQHYTFPVSFNNGFTWSAEEDSHMFSYYKDNDFPNHYISYPGIGIDLHEARGKLMHWLIAVEDSRVVWVNDKVDFAGGNQSCVLLKSKSQPNIYYLYNHLFTKNVAVKSGQELVKGEAVGTAWGNASWGHLHFAVIFSPTEPTFQECSGNVVNGFPQLFGLYNPRGSHLARNFTRGRIIFGQPRSLRGNVLNNLEFEPYTGKGWTTGKWNPADKVEWISKGNEGNIRLKKVLFEGTPGESTNPHSYFDYQISVLNGTYRMRVKVGDVYLPTWQKMEFEGVDAGIKNLKAGEFSWTGERIVKVNDGILNVRVYIDSTNNMAAGISELVFQAVN